MLLLRAVGSQQRPAECRVAIEWVTLGLFGSYRSVADTKLTDATSPSDSRSSTHYPGARQDPGRPDGLAP